MNTVPDMVASVAGLAPMETLLAPLSADAPCGPAARYDPVFTAVRLLREEDDPSLPMGQWERPLKRADWPQIERDCTDMLVTRSKDLQIAVWLVEAWMRQRGFVGLMQGLQLIDALLRRYWAPLHPVIDADGDGDARLAPLEWLNESLSVSVRLHAVLLVLDGDKPTNITLADWERINVQDRAAGELAGRQAADATPVALTRSDLQHAALRAAGDLATTAAAVALCRDALHSVGAVLQQQLAAEAPNLGKLRQVLEAAQRVLVHLQPEEKAAAMTNQQAEEHAVDDGGPALLPCVADVAAPAAATALAHWRNRDEAYATLAALADYLSQAEPHSPTPFLLRRAVNWGRMTLPEVIAEIIREEGDVTRLLQVLGVRLAP